VQGLSATEWGTLNASLCCRVTIKIALLARSNPVAVAKVPESAKRNSHDAECDTV